tara:strand:+ start:213 stop:389 length:177 start_codon:yes stop_codon:yes gene_type:complete
MSGRMASAWFKWVEAKLSRLENTIENLEESLKDYKRIQKRMLYAIGVLVVINGILLFV